MLPRVSRQTRVPRCVQELKNAADRPGAATHEDEVTATDRARDEIALVTHLGIVAKVQPAFREDQFLLAFEDFGVAIGIAMDPEPAVSRVDIDEPPFRNRCAGHQRVPCLGDGPRAIVYRLLYTGNTHTNQSQSTNSARVSVAADAAGSGRVGFATRDTADARTRKRTQDSTSWPVGKFTSRKSVRLIMILFRTTSQSRTVIAAGWRRKPLTLHLRD